MREFKCIEGPEILCHVPYPYPNAGVVTAADLSWLEHSLLFFYKRPADYGAKMAHGLVYTLTMTPDGFRRDAAVDRPRRDRHAAGESGRRLFSPASTAMHIQPGTRWYDSLTIEPHR